MIKKVHLITMMTYFITMFLAIIAFVKILRSSNVILLLVHLAVTLTTIVFYVYYGWNRFIGDYVYDKCHLVEYVDLLNSKKRTNKNAKKVLRDLSFITADNTTVTDSTIDRFIQIEKAILSGDNTEAIDEQIIMDLKQADGSFIPHYTEVLELIMQRNYQHALNKLDSLRNKTNMEDIPRQFYTAYVLDKIGGCNDEIASCISFLSNRGKESRYSEYAKMYLNTGNTVEDKSDTKELTEIPRVWILFIIYVIWMVLLYIK